MAPKLAPSSTLFIVCLLLLLLLLQILSLVQRADCQVIALRQPQSDGRLRFVRLGRISGQSEQVGAINHHRGRHHHHHHRQQLPARPGHQQQHQARPGNVIVHFDRDHDIQRLQYVLRDGRLATLYQRQPAEANQQQNQPQQQQQQQQQAAHSMVSARMQEQPPSSIVSTSATDERHKVDEQPRLLINSSQFNGSASGRPSEQKQKQQHQHQQQHQPLEPTNEHSIEILDDKLRSIAHLIGDQHATIELPAKVVGIGVEGDNIVIDKPPMVGLLEPGNEKTANHNEHQTLKILTTIAQDAIHEGVHLGEAKLKKKVDGLKHKFGMKLRELPHLIRKKLRAKSSLGVLFIDGPDVASNTKSVIVNDNVIQQQPISQQIVQQTNQIK